ncbi:MAG: rhodanese-like protein [Solirubrobacterales bacterium]|jgi:rhodanese-related sulfurtransferase|nr:rhodanese-like protein [Solirubrobacterales bacterium]
MSPAFPSEPGIEVTPEQTEQALADGTAILVDVREGYEWDAGRVEGATHIELERLASKSDELPKNTTIIFNCRLGARSAMAAQAFRGAGFDAWSMAGGLERWHAEGRPLVPEDGTVADH